MPNASSTAARAKPTVSADSAAPALRMGPYDTLVAPRGYGNQILADQGSYFTSINNAPGSGISMGTTPTSFSATSAKFLLHHVIASSKRVIPHYIRIVAATAPTGTSRLEGLIALDTGGSRYTSGGTNLFASRRAHQIGAEDRIAIATGRSTNCLAYLGVLVVAAETANVRRIARFQLRTSIPIINDEYVIVFGESRSKGHANLASATAIRSQVNVGPCALPPDSDLLLHLWWPDATATQLQCEVEFAWLEV